MFDTLAKVRREDHQKMIMHTWLINNDPDYAFECAVMGLNETYNKYTRTELMARRDWVQRDDPH